MEGEFIGASLAILAALSYSIHIIFIRKATVSGKPLDSVIATVWITALIFLPLSLLLYYPNFGLNVKSLSAFVISGLAGNLFGYFFYYEGTERAGAARAVPISRASLLVATLFAIFILGETLTTGHLLGILLIAGGVFIVGYEIESGESQSSLESRLALLFPLGAMICFGLSAPIGKIGLSEGTPVFVGLTIKFWTALAALTGFFIWKNNSPIQPFKEKEKRLYIGAGLGLALGNGFLFSALNVTKVVVAMPFYSLTPLFAVILSYFYLKRLERITIILILGSILVVTGGIIISIYM